MNLRNAVWKKATLLTEVSEQKARVGIAYKHPAPPQLPRSVLTQGSQASVRAKSSSASGSPAPSAAAQNFRVASPRDDISKDYLKEHYASISKKAQQKQSQDRVSALVSSIAPLVDTMSRTFTSLCWSPPRRQRGMPGNICRLSGPR